MKKYTSTKIIELGSCAFRQWRAVDTHCKYIHGYQLKAKFWFEGTLDERNWVVNFGGLRELKSDLQKQFDHTLCIAADDPEMGMFQAMHEVGVCDLRVMESVGIEKTAEWCFKRANLFLQSQPDTHNRCRVTKVEVWEHEANSAIFTETTIS